MTGYEPIWSGTDEDTFNYLVKMVNTYSKAYESKGIQLMHDLFGVNGETQAKTRSRVMAINSLSAERKESPQQTIEYLFMTLQEPDKILEALSKAHDQRSLYFGIPAESFAHRFAWRAFMRESSPCFKSPKIVEAAS